MTRRELLAALQNVGDDTPVTTEDGLDAAVTIRPGVVVITDVADGDEQ